MATLPYSNVCFAKAYPVERIESLLDGIESALRYLGGLVDRAVLDNTSLAVKDVLAGRDRVQTEAFEAGGLLRSHARPNGMRSPPLAGRRWEHNGVEARPQGRASEKLPRPRATSSPVRMMNVSIFLAKPLQEPIRISK